MTHLREDAAPFRSPDEPAPIETVFSVGAGESRRREIVFLLVGALLVLFAMLQIVGFLEMKHPHLVAVLPDLRSDDADDPKLTAVAVALEIIGLVLATRSLLALVLPFVVVTGTLESLRSRNRFVDRAHTNYWFWEIRAARARWWLRTERAPELARRMRVDDHVRITSRRVSRAIVRIERIANGAAPR